MYVTFQIYFIIDFMMTMAIIIIVVVAFQPSF